MPTSVRVTLDHAAISNLTLTVTAKSSAKAAKACVDRVKANISVSGRVRSGRMRDSVTATLVESTPTRCTWSIGSSLNYFAYQDQGTGGSRARSGGVLRIQLRSGTIFRPRSGPIRAGRFLQGAASALSLNDFLGA